MGAWYASLAEWQRWCMAVLCIPLIPIVAILVMVGLPVWLLAATARDGLDSVFGVAKPLPRKGRSL